MVEYLKSVLEGKFILAAVLGNILAAALHSFILGFHWRISHVCITVFCVVFGWLFCLVFTYPRLTCCLFFLFQKLQERREKPCVTLSWLCTSFISLQWFLVLEIQLLVAGSCHMQYMVEEEIWNTSCLTNQFVIGSKCSPAIGAWHVRWKQSQSADFTTAVNPSAKKCEEQKKEGWKWLMLVAILSKQETWF